jgi:hypothetical protein
MLPPPLRELFAFERDQFVCALFPVVFEVAEDPKGCSCESMAGGVCKSVRNVKNKVKAEKVGDVVKAEFGSVPELRFGGL